MSHRPVIQFPDSKLRAVANPVRDFHSEAFQTLICDMVATMRKRRGIGLAATQIGVALQVAVIELKDGPLVMANPVVNKLSRQQEEDEEGCLSVVAVFGMVPRAAALHLRAQDAHGRWYEMNAKGLFARVIQHEYEHLQGKLFVDRCTRITAGAPRAHELGLAIPS